MKSAKILFIEDDRVAQRAFMRMLRKKDLPWEVELADTLASARAHLSRSHFDVIIADNHLPDGESPELFGEIADTPFVLVTGSLVEQLALRTLERGADDYLVKDVGHCHLEALPFAVEKTLYRKAIHEKEKRLSQELRESEERSRGTFENAAVGITHIDLNGRYLRVNQRFCEMLGYSREELLGRQFEDFTYPGDNALDGKQYPLLMAGQIDRHEVEKRYIRKDGNALWALVTSSIQRDHSGNPLYAISVVQDITQRKNAEEQLRRIAQFPEENPNPVLRISNKGNLLYANRAGMKLLNKMGDDTERSILVLKMLMRSGSDCHFERDISIPGGKVFSFTVARISNAGYINLYGQDVTEQRKAEEEVQKSGQMIGKLADAMSERARLLDLTNDAIIIKDEDSRINYWGGGATKMFGYTTGQAIGRTTNELLKTAFPEPLDHIIDKLHRNGQWSGELVKTRKDGSTIITMSQWVLDRGSKERPTQILETDTDISERKGTEDALRKSEDRYRGIVRASAAAVWTAQADGSVAEDSPSWREFTGQTLEQMLGWGWLDAIHPDDRSRAENDGRRAFKHEETYHTEYRLWHAPSAKYRNTLVRAVRVLNEDGSTREWVGSNIDVTELREAEDARRKSEDFLRLALSAIKMGTWNYDPATGKISYDERAKDILGGARHDSYAQALEQVIHPEDVSFVNTTMQDALRPESNGTFSAECRLLWPDGSLHWVRADGRTIFGGEGTNRHAVAMTGTCRDVTDRKNAEEALREARKSAENAKMIAEQANRAKDHFLAVLSHELRTPLTPVVLGLSILQDKPGLAPQMSDTLEMIRQNVEMEARLIDDLLDVTRISRGKIELNRRQVQLCKVIERAVEVCKPDIEARNLHFGVDMGPSAPYWIDADPSRLQQVFWNLLKNAVKFTPHGGCVGIRCRPNETHVSIEVNDSGIGIEPEALPRVFDAFEQAERSITRQFGGLGLGLAISKALVEMHGGEISAESRGRNKGATFKVLLPLSVPTEKATTVAETAGTSVRPLRILLVEDHGVTAQMIKMVLKERGHSVEVAGDVATAVELAGRQSFDLLLSDLGLPDGSGHDLIRELRSKGYDFPAIALSGYGQEDDLRRSQEAGFSAHLIKPASREAIDQALACVIAGNGISCRNLPLIL